ncbi:unnamed protein product [Cladocopium goreaui]|uniref:Cryptochrome DASH n=1 Tax=Cladocopium goreaui TaxID=2562237 RepID=A0A9P1BQG2_9DINO|nr:unnamed protein product [Cladocopium goreaui]
MTYDATIPLRLVLHRAEELARRCDKPVLLVYVIDPRYFETSPFGVPRTGAFRAQFLLESLVDLKKNLKDLQSDLLPRSGRAEEVFPELLPRGSVLITQQEVTRDELRVDDALRRNLEEQGVSWEYCWGLTLFHKEDLPFQGDLSNMPDVFTPFKNAVAPELKCACNQIPAPYSEEIKKTETGLRIRPCFPAPARGALPLPKSIEFGDLPTALDLPCETSRAVAGWPGGEGAALRRLEDYMAGPIETYAETKNNMLDPFASTKLAPWLSNGCLSVRRVFEALRRVESTRGASASTYWLTFALLVRDFFRFMACKHGSKIFLEGGLNGKRIQWTGGDHEFRLWSTGQTGYPLVDANMRELRSTGWMSNRGRQNVASFLVLDLHVDWRRGADWFESYLLDYDVASNWTNWVFAAGLNGRVNRFNVVKQSKQYDPDGDYLRHWLPELQHLSIDHIHEPWRSTEALNYPAPCVAPERFAERKVSHNGHGRAGCRSGAIGED